MYVIHIGIKIGHEDKRLSAIAIWIWIMLLKREKTKCVIAALTIAWRQKINFTLHSKVVVLYTYNNIESPTTIAYPSTECPTWMSEISIFVHRSVLTIGWGHFACHGRDYTCYKEIQIVLAFVGRFNDLLVIGFALRLAPGVTPSSSQWVRLRKREGLESTRALRRVRVA